MSLREDAIAIWKAGLAAVDSARLCRQSVQLDDERLQIADRGFPLSRLNRIEVVGAGKAGAGMAAGLEQSLLHLPHRIEFSGWVNVPADCVRDLRHIHLHAARPAGLNEPTAEAVAGTEEILKRVGRLGERDLCIVLLSGGGSALLCSPVSEITLDDKITVTRLLAQRGAPIDELNVVRTQLSQVKGGGLLRACRAEAMVSLIISDVVGDPVATIASGPTVSRDAPDPDALQILRDRGIERDALPQRVLRFLNEGHSGSDSASRESLPQCDNRIIGSNRVAAAAAAEEAKCRGYAVESLGSDNEGDAAGEGRAFFRRLSAKRESAPGEPVCLLSGGEPTVKLAAVDVPRSGGRNQEFILAAVTEFRSPQDWKGITVLSGGTDGEDGPTDAAGAVADEILITRMNAAQVDPATYLKINNSYPFFRDLEGLLLTGPTHTNVMDLRVGLVRPDDSPF